LQEVKRIDSKLGTFDNKYSDYAKDYMSKITEIERITKEMNENLHKD